MAAVSTVALAGVTVPAHAAPTAAESVQSEAASPRALEEIIASGDDSVRAPGERFHVLAYRLAPPAITGRFEFTVPDHVEIVAMQHQSQGQLPFTLHDDGRTARSVSASVPMPNGIFMQMRLSEDAPRGAVLEGGAMRMLAPDGEPLAAGTFTVSVLDVPIVGEHPVDVIVDVGSGAEFTTSASGDGVHTQWQVSTDSGVTWSDIEDATGTTLRLGATTPEMNRWWYRAVHTNPAGSVHTDHAVLTVRVVPYFTMSPSNVVVSPAGHAGFTTWALDNASTTSLAVAWEVSRDGVVWEPYEPGTFEEGDLQFPNHLWLVNVTADMDGLRFRAVAENHLGRAVSDPALLTVASAPVIDSHPADVRTLVGHDAVFRAAPPRSHRTARSSGSSGSRTGSGSISRVRRSPSTRPGPPRWAWTGPSTGSCSRTPTARPHPSLRP